LRKYVKREFRSGRIFRDVDDFDELLRICNIEIADVR